MCQGQNQPASFVGSLSFFMGSNKFTTLLRIDELISFTGESDCILNYESRSNLWIRYGTVRAKKSSVYNEKGSSLTYKLQTPSAL